MLKSSHEATSLYLDIQVKNKSRASTNHLPQNSFAKGEKIIVQLELLQLNSGARGKL